ncbi:TonB-dependent receptor [Salegentibacter sediminis]|uniref:TonB-dependent receptor n=1 Tax=Salegentibacter sediminis TaxID=1930251 RepID=UPI0009C11E38|nr:TonB-dependent receptor [Salegentibacter sediminis]
MKTKILFLLFLAVNSFIYAQNNLQGTVKNLVNGEPVIGATVYLPGLEKGELTDLDGKFMFKNLPTGNHKIVISSIGFSTFSGEISIPSSAGFDLSLKPSAIEMEEVIISTPFHQLQSDNVMRVARENVSTLTRKGAITLTDGISQIEGVESLTTGLGIGKPVIRGLSSNRVLVYTQGVRLENQQYGDEHGLGISSKGIESVEVIKGPASLLYGSDAIGGVLYLNPEAFASTNASKAEIETNYFSNTQGYQGSAMAATSGEKLKFIARGSYAAHSDYETGDGERVTNTRFNEKDFKAGIGYQDQKYKGALRYNYNRSNIGIPEEMGLQNTDKDPLLPYQEIDNHILSLDNKLYFKNSSLDFKVGYQFNNRREYEDEHAHEEEEEIHEEEEDNVGEHPALEMHLETLNYNLKYNFPRFGKFETIAGIQGMYQTNTNLGEEILIPEATTTDIGIFVTTHLHLEKWDFQGGLRYDFRNLDSEEFGHHEHEEEELDPGHEEEFIPALNRDFNSINGAIGAKYDFSESINARLNLASGFRAPNLAELTSNGAHHGANRYEIGDSSLDNEQNFQIDLSVEYRNEHFETYVNLFHNTIKDYIYLNPTGEMIDNDLVFQYTQNNASMYGSEIGAHIHPHPLDWLHWETGFEMVHGELEDGQNLPLIPANSLTNTFRIELEGEIVKKKYAFLRLENVFDQNRVSPFETRTGGYSLLGAGFGGTFDLNGSDLQFTINGNNLFNKTYISHLSRLKPDNIANIGRNISVALNWFL